MANSITGGEFLLVESFLANDVSQMTPSPVALMRSLFIFSMGGVHVENSTRKGRWTNASKLKHFGVLEFTLTTLSK